MTMDNINLDVLDNLAAIIEADEIEHIKARSHQMLLDHLERQYNQERYRFPQMDISVNIESKRDSQRGKLYKAERSLDIFRSPRLETVGEIEQYCEKVANSVWFDKQYPKRKFKKFTIGDGRHRKSACGNINGTIKFPKSLRSELIVLHEIAHTVTHALPHHGYEFANNMLLLVKHLSAHDSLKAAFKAHKVRFTPKRKAVSRTPEQAQMMKDRMAKARAARKHKDA